MRPLNDAEAEKGSAWKIDSNKIVPLSGAVREESNFVLDSVFDSSSTTEQVFEQTTGDLIVKIVEGFNGTVFAYGQTSSGKTHTMRGSASAPGIIPLSIQRVFSHIEAAQDREFLLRVSYIEVLDPPTLSCQQWSLSTTASAARRSELMLRLRKTSARRPATSQSTAGFCQSCTSMRLQQAL